MKYFFIIYTKKIITVCKQKYRTIFDVSKKAIELQHWVSVYISMHMHEVILKYLQIFIHSLVQ